MSRLSIVCALIGGPAVLILELIRRAGTLFDVLPWLDDAVGAGLLVAAALMALRGRAQFLPLAWALAAGQLLMSLLGQLQQTGADPSGQPGWVVVAVKAVLLVAAAALAVQSQRHLTRGP